MHVIHESPSQQKIHIFETQVIRAKVQTLVMDREGYGRVSFRMRREREGVDPGRISMCQDLTPFWKMPCPFLSLDLQKLYKCRSDEIHSRPLCGLHKGKCSLPLAYPGLLIILYHHCWMQCVPCWCSFNANSGG